MTKAQEIARIDGLIATLGPNTYIGPWLKSVRDHVASMITNDIFPDLSMKDTAEAIAKMKADCEREITQKRERAEREATKIVADAKMERDAIFGRARRDLEGALAAIRY